MSGFLASAGVYVSEQTARPARPRAPRRPAHSAPVLPVLDTPVTPAQRRDAECWRALPRRHALGRSVFVLRLRPESEDVDKMLAYGQPNQCARPPLTVAPSVPPAESHHADTPAPLLPLPGVQAARPHPRRDAGRGQDGGDFGEIMYQRVWVGLEAQSVRALPRAGRGRVPAVEVRWALPGIDPEVPPWGGSAAAPRRPHAGRSAGALAVAGWEAEPLGWQTTLAAPPRTPGRAPHVALATPLAEAVEQVWWSVALSGAAPAPRVSRGRGGVSADPVAAPYMGVVDAEADALRGWMGGQSVRPVRAVPGGRAHGEALLIQQYAAPSPVVLSQEFAAPPRGGRAAPHVEYSAPDWHGAGLVIYAAVVVPDED